MEFNYLVGLKLVNPSPKHSLLEEAFKTKIIDAVNEYNIVCSNSRKNKKELTIVEIGEKNIILSLSSEVELSVPGKALRSFSQILLRNQDFKDAFIFFKQLFATYDVANEKLDSSDKKHISADDIDDTLFLTSLVDYFLNKRDPDTKIYLRKRKAIEKMKVLAYECDIVKFKEEN